MTPLRKTKTILVGGFLALLLCMLGLVSLGISHYGKMNQAWEREAVLQEKVRQAYRMREAVRKRTFSLAYVTSLGDFFERDEERLRFHSYAGDFIVARERLLGLGLTEREAALLEAARDAILAAQPAVDTAMDLAVDSTAPPPVIRAQMNEARRRQQDLVQSLDRFVDYLGQASRAKEREERAAVQQDAQSMGLLAGLLMLTGIAVGTYVIRREIWAANTLYREVSDRRQAEAAVRDLNRALEDRVAARTRELTDEIQRREAYEARLRESEIRHRAVIDTAADGIITLDADACIESFNPAAERIFGFAEAEVLGRNFALLLPGDEPPWTSDDIAMFLIRNEDGIGVGGREMAGGRRDGRVFPLSLAIREMNAGGSRHFVAMVEDISERKRAEQQILAEKERAETYLDVAEAMFLELDAEGRILRVNRRFCDVVGCGPETIIGTGYFDTFIPPGERSAVRQAFVRFAGGQAGDSRHVETRLLTRGGEYRAIRWHDTLRTDGSGRVVGTLSSGQDVTEYRRHEASLRQAKNEAELANRTKSEFLANMSHELRTPLNAIIGFSDLIRNQVLGPLTEDRYQDYLDDIHTSGEHLLELVNDILDVSKIEAGQLEVHAEPLALPDLAESALRLVRQRAEKRGVRLEIHLPAGLPKLLADARHLKQILLNLLTNAVKFSHAGGVVRLAARRAEGGSLLLTVSDTGIGMKPEDIPKALAPFIQVERGRFADHEGTGLGLPLVKGLMEAHGGRLDLDSALGEGTTASLHFPPERTVEPAEEGRGLIRNAG